ncbi:MAG: CDP-alcohol phosphatidyltransferase family protein [Leptospiraceae bacterium]|nr:CDP-alcohol phosphatidyltransferase family protein [Leptospiraceae bacterium]MCP5503151.1 CDP-alcohol phosphatidyltransferase family protein [Leptospiraceae bacterium]
MKDLLLLPNILTLLRILLVIPSIALFEYGHIYYALPLVVFLFLTDFLDGWIARNFEMKSYIGSILDPVADKLVVLSFFSYFYYRGEIILWYYLLILIRDIAQLLSIPILLLWKKIAFQVKPKQIPKWGTAFNFIILGLLASRFYTGSEFFNQFVKFYLFYPLLILSSVIELYILFTYIPRFIQIYRGTHDTFE